MEALPTREFNTPHAILQEGIYLAARHTGTFEANRVVCLGIKTSSSEHARGCPGETGGLLVEAKHKRWEQSEDEGRLLAGPAT